MNHSMYNIIGISGISIIDEISSSGETFNKCNAIMQHLSYLIYDDKYQNIDLVRTVLAD